MGIPRRPFYAKLINTSGVFKYLHRLSKTKFSPRKILHELKRLIDYTLYVAHRHTRSLHPNEMAMLDNSCKDIAYTTEIVDDKVKLKLGLKTSQESLSKPFKLSSVYLLRHPEKPSKQDPTNKNISRRGVKQARDFAQYLVEELLLCPRPVSVQLYCSDLRRTFLFGEIIRREIVRAKEKYEKTNLKVSGITQHPALYFRFSAADLEQIGADYKKDEFDCFKKWISGKYVGLQDAKKVAAEIKAWARQATKVDSTDTWNVIVGVSHSFSIDTMLREAIGKDHDAIIGLADFVRFVGGEMVYNKKWYKI
jgi:broad specificity phosphatase PhoE